MTAPQDPSVENPVVETASRGPSLFADRSFVGMTATQFLGAFNDNVFKQLVLLLAVDYVRMHELDHDPYQAAATVLFTLPFLVFSGTAGFLSDRYGKRAIIVLCKVGEIVVMSAGLAVLFLFPGGSDVLLMGLMGVLAVMGLQSAFFGPPKYGILPELIREKDLSAANGVIQMTTFLAIILGTALAGKLKYEFPDRLWVCVAVCVFIAVLGTVTSLMIRPTPAAHPGMRFHWSSLLIEREAFRHLIRDKVLLRTLFVYSIFWFVGGVVMQTVNLFGKVQLGLDDLQTSLSLACLASGIAGGCLLYGLMARDRIRLGFVLAGGIGAAASLTFTAAADLFGFTPAVLLVSVRVGLFVSGLCAGMFAVPLQVVLQARPPHDQKGRMIGAMNLCNWVLILAASVFYFLGSVVLARWNLPIGWLFSAAGVVLMLAGMYCRLRIVPVLQDGVHAGESALRS